MVKKENIPLIIGLCIPAVLVVIVALAIYLPVWFSPDPAYNFIYSSASHGHASHFYTVENNTLTKKDAPPPYEGYSGQLTHPALKLYDIKNNQSRDISLREAQNYTLDENRSSPDGFEVVRGSQEFDPFFTGYNSLNKAYLRGHGVSKELNIGTSPRSCYDHFDFIGWVIE